MYQSRCLAEAYDNADLCVMDTSECLCSTELLNRQVSFAAWKKPLGSIYAQLANQGKNRTQSDLK